MSLFDIKPPKKSKKSNFKLKPVKPISLIVKPRKPKMKNLIFGYDRPKPARKVKGKLAMNWTQAKRKFPKMSPFGDADRDGVKNWLDCKPFDKKRQGRSKLWTAEVERRLKKIIPTEEQERARISRANVPRFKKAIESEIKDSKRILKLVKGEREGNAWMDKIYGQASGGNLDHKIKRKRGEYYKLYSPKSVREFHKEKLKKYEKRKKEYIKDFGEAHYNRSTSGKTSDKRKDIIRHFQKVPQDLAHAETLEKIKIRTRMEGDTAGMYRDRNKTITLEARKKSEISGVDKTLAHELEHHKQYKEGVGDRLQDEGHEIRRKQNWKPLKHSERPIEIDIKKRLKARAVKVKEAPEALVNLEKVEKKDKRYEDMAKDLLAEEFPEGKDDPEIIRETKESLMKDVAIEDEEIDEKNKE